MDAKEFLKKKQEEGTLYKSTSGSNYGSAGGFSATQPTDSYNSAVGFDPNRSLPLQEAREKNKTLGEKLIKANNWLAENLVLPVVKPFARLGEGILEGSMERISNNRSQKSRQEKQAITEEITGITPYQGSAAQKGLQIGADVTEGVSTLASLGGYGGFYEGVKTTAKNFLAGGLAGGMREAGTDGADASSVLGASILEGGLQAGTDFGAAMAGKAVGKLFGRGAKKAVQQAETKGMVGNAVENIKGHWSEMMQPKQVAQEFSARYTPQKKVIVENLIGDKAGRFKATDLEGSVTMNPEYKKALRETLQVADDTLSPRGSKSDVMEPVANLVNRRVENFEKKLVETGKKFDTINLATKKTQRMPLAESKRIANDTLRKFNMNPQVSAIHGSAPADAPVRGELATIQHYIKNIEKIDTLPAFNSNIQALQGEVDTLFKRGDTRAAKAGQEILTTLKEQRTEFAKRVFGENSPEVKAYADYHEAQDLIRQMKNTILKKISPEGLSSAELAKVKNDKLGTLLTRVDTKAHPEIVEDLRRLATYTGENPDELVHLIGEAARIRNMFGGRKSGEFRGVGASGLVQTMKGNITAAASTVEKALGLAKPSDRRLLQYYIELLK